MLIGFAGASGRTDASHAALATVQAVRAAEGRGNLLVLHDPASHPVPVGLGDGADRASGSADAGEASLGEWAARLRADGIIGIVDVPMGVLLDADDANVFDLRIVVVGPHADDERAAADAVSRAATHPVWYLGCRRGGGSPAATRFAASMAELDRRARVLSVTLPPFGRGEAAALEHGPPAGRALRSGLLIMESVRQALSRPLPGPFTPLGSDASNEAERIALGADCRTLPDRLRDLADDIESVEAGQGPSAADLACAPVLDGWSRDMAVTPVLKGRVTGHPGIIDGHRVRTSEVYLTDRATWARTLSRWYVLRAPADAPASGLQ